MPLMRRAGNALVHIRNAGDAVATQSWDVIFAGSSATYTDALARKTGGLAIGIRRSIFNRVRLS